MELIRVKEFLYRQFCLASTRLSLRGNRRLLGRNARELAKTTKWLNWAMDGRHGMSTDDIEGINAFRDVLFIEQKMWTSFAARDEEVLEILSRERSGNAMV